MRLRLGASKPTPLPPELDQPEVLAFLAAMLAWRHGDEPPKPPAQLTMTVPELMDRLGDPAIRRGVVERLSVLTGKCLVAECGRPIEGGGFCRIHGGRRRR